MTMRKNTSHTIVLLALFLVGAAAAQAQTTPNARAIWGAPTYGTPVEHYVLELSTDEGAWQEVGTTAGLQYDLTLAEGHSYRIRVAGVDADGHQGPYGLPSESYTPSVTETAPGKPGQPYLAGL